MALPSRDTQDHALEQHEDSNAAMPPRPLGDFREMQERHSVYELHRRVHTLHNFCRIEFHRMKEDIATLREEIRQHHLILAQRIIPVQRLNSMRPSCSCVQFLRNCF